MKKSMHSQSGENLPRLLLVGAFLALLAATAASDANRLQGKQGDLLPVKQQQQQDSDLLAANFYSIKDGKTSARRIVQQPAAQVSLPEQNAAKDEFVSQSALLNENQAKNSELDDNRQQSNGEEQQRKQQVSTESNQAQSPGSGQSSVAGQASDDQQARTDENITQQQLMINSFNQLVGSGALDDFATSTTSSLQAQTGSSSLASQSASSGPQQGSEQEFTTTAASAGGPAPSTESAEGGQAIGQQVLFTTSTGAPLSTPNSISMSLDGMIVNSRPRASSDSGSNAGPGERKQRPASKASSQARIGESAPARLSGTEASSGASAKASRRVPFSGAPFSSPASKGQRAKPKSTGGQLSSFVVNQQQQTAARNGISGPQAADLIAGLQLDSMSQRAPINPNPKQNQANQRQQSRLKQQVEQQRQMDSSQGFDEEQQRISVSPKEMDANTLEVMKSLMGNSVMRSQDSRKAMNPDDMVMSVMSSADGKERRLVMIARDTLDSLQRFAAQAQSPPTKSKSPAPGRQQRPAAVEQSPRGGEQANNWWPNGQRPTSSSGSGSNSGSVGEQSTASGSGESAGGQSGQEVQLQTTTAAPFSSFALQTTTTTSAPTTISSSSQDSQSLAGSNSSTPVSTLQTQTQTQTQTQKTPTTTSDSFREVPVSTLANSEVSSVGGSSGQEEQPVKQSAGKQQQVATGVKSKTNGGKQQQVVAGKQEQQSVGGGQQRSRPSKGAKAKKNGAGSAKQQAGSGSKGSGKASGGRKSAGQSQGAKKQQAVRPTNGQQKVAAGRAPEQPAVAKESRRANGTNLNPIPNLSEDSGSGTSTTTQPMEPTSGQQPDQQVGQRQPESTTGASLSTRRPSAQQQQARDSSGGQFGRRPSASWQGADESEADRLDSLRAAIPGEPMLDYPIYAAPPKTSFDCMSQSCPGGYYADLESQCQVFHICQNDGRFDTFLCPNGTIFSQQHFVCVWWWQVDCKQSATFYKLNDAIYCNSMFPASISSSPANNALTSDSSDAPQRSNGTSAAFKPLDGASNANELTEDAPKADTSGFNRNNAESGNQKQQESLDDADQQQQQQQQLEQLARRA